jgi:hypothetical protein
MKRILFAICTLQFSIYLFAQTDSSEIKPFQVSLFYPIGSSGLYSTDYGYITSINLLAGITGSNNGLEIGGLINANKIYSHGAQVGGICNITGSYSTGAEIAGICNINGGASTGFQVGGIGNIVGGSVTGMQTGGIFNITGNSVRGAQISGIVNIDGGTMKGFEVAGIINGNIDTVTGVQIAGIVNSASIIEGLQVAGVANLVNSANACQVAGVTNLNAGESKIQVAGVGNIAADVKGIQIGGVFNVAQTVKGVQLAGVVNICDSIDGVPVALISIVRKNGYRRFEIWGTEALYMNFSYKIGIRELYSIITLGYSTKDIHDNLGLGVGLGTEMKLGNRNCIDLEAYFYQINHYLWMDEDNFLYTLKLNYALNLNNRIALFVGPTFNMLCTNINSDAHAIAPGYSVEYKGSNDWQYWAGFNAGIRF